MTLHRNSFLGQTDGTNATVANSAASGSPFTTVTPGTGGSVKYSNLHPGDGLMGLECTWGGGAVGAFVEDATFNAPQLSDEFVFWFSGTAPIATSSLFSARSAAGQHFGININTSKQLVITSPTGTILWTIATPVLTAGLWRLAIQGTSDATAGTIDFQLYSGAQSTTPVATKSLTAQNTRGGNMTTVRHGLVTSTNFGSPVYIDSIQTADTGTPIGPYPPPNVLPSASFTHSETGLTVTVSSTSTDADGTIASYDWDWGDGTAHGTTASASHTYATTGTRTITLTVADNLGGTGTASASITMATAPTTGVSQVDAAIVTANTTPGGGGTISYAITQTGGATTTPLLISAGKWAIPRHITDALVYTITSTESPSGLITTSSVTVDSYNSTGDQILVRNAGSTAWV